MTSGTTKVRLRAFSRSLPMSLLRSREAVMKHFRSVLRQHDLTEQQWRVLRALQNVVQIEVTDLARSTYLLGPSLSRILRDLEARRLLSRKNDKNDQRRFNIAITKSGHALIDQVSPHSEAIYADITRRFGAEKLAALQEMLRELEECMVGEGEALHPDDDEI